MHITKDDHIGAVVSIAIHALLLLLFLWLKLYRLEPADSGGGMEIDFGVSAQGMGDNENAVPTSPNPSENPQLANNNPTPVENSNTSEEVLKTSDNEPSITNKVEKPKVENKVTKPEVKPVTNVAKPNNEVKPEKPGPQVNASALYPGKNNNVEGQGNGNKPGNEGNPDGKPGGGGQGGTGNNPNGTGNGIGVGPGNNPGNSRGKGVSFDLSGRGAKLLPTPVYDSREEGIVKVKITVDRNGNVVNATTDGVRGSTTTDKVLHARAIDAAKKSKFDVKADAPPEQIGYITYNFVLN
jgi:outer membrane biosynthesis protein TonB